MADHTRGEVEVEAGGKKHVLRLTINQLISVQDALGYGDKDEEFMKELLTGRLFRSFKKLRTLVYVAMQDATEDVTEEQAGDLITAMTLAKMPTVMLQCLRWAMPAAEPDEPRKKGGKPRPSPGPTSS
jgi:DNA-binding protein YbaB